MIAHFFPTGYITDMDYACPAALVRTMGNRRLAPADYERVLQAVDEADLLRILEQAGYHVPAGMEHYDYRDLIQQFNQNLVNFTAAQFTDKHKNLEQFIRSETDFINLKEQAKRELHNNESEPGFIEGGTFDPSIFNESSLIDAGMYLPEELRIICEEYADLLDSGMLDNYRYIAVFFDTRKLKLLLQLARTIGSEFILNYTRVMIDCLNIETLYRLRRQEELVPGGFLVDGGFVETDRLSPLLQGDNDRLSEAYSASPYAAYTVRIDEALRESGDIRSVARGVNAIRSDFLGNEKYIPFGPEVIVAYYYRQRAELYNIKTVLLARRSGLAFNKVKDQLTVWS